MKNFLLALVALLGLTGAAFASDLPRRVAPVAPQPVYAAPLFDGFSVGVNAGYNWSQFDTARGSSDLNAAVIGAGVGYDKRWGAIVVGVEADLAGGYKAKTSDAFYAPATTSLAFLGTVRGRLGHVFGDNLLIYGTGGLAYAAIDTEVTRANGATQTQGRVSPGYVFGAGAEYALSTHWSVKGEYLRIGLANRSYELVGDSGKFKADLARVGVNYRF